MIGIGGNREGIDGGGDWDDHGRADALETEQLSLAQDSERLPWLESPEDDDEDYGASDTRRLLGFAAIAVMALAAIVGGIWWATHRISNPALQADGSTIEAPKTPYKEAPKDPGGKTFDGTGDSSFVVSEGQNRPAKLGDQPADTPAPAPASAAPAAAAPAAKASPAAKTGPAAAAAKAPAAPAKASGVGVQVGAYSSQTSAEAGWNKLVTQSAGVLSGVSHRVVEGNADIGKVYRLQAVAGDAAGANALCARLKAAGIACQVK